MITTILYQDSGTIELHNIPPNTNRSLYIGYMPEERGLYKKMKVGEHLLYLARLKGFSAKEARTKVDFWLDKLAITDWKNRPIEELSKGMQQKIQFIAAVVHEPKLIILDEPFSGLDPINANIIQDVIFALRQRGSTIIFSTHRMEQVEQICEQIALVNKGRVVLNGNVADIKQQFKKNLFAVGYTHTLPNLPDAPFNIIENQNNVLTIALNTNTQPNNTLSYLLSKEVSIISFNEILPSLHEIFVQQVNN